MIAAESMVVTVLSVCPETPGMNLNSTTLHLDEKSAAFPLTERVEIAFVVMMYWYKLPSICPLPFRLEVNSRRALP